MTEGGTRPDRKDRARHLIAELPESNDDRHGIEQGELAVEVGTASVPFLSGGLVGRGRTTNRRGDVDPEQAESIVDSDGQGLVRQANPEQGPEQEVAGPITGEHPAGPVGPVGGRSQPHDQDGGVRVAEARHRTTPVLLVPVCGTTLERHLLSPRHEPGAGPAGNHFGGHGLQ